MTAALRRAIWLLGAGQCAYWGMIYYGFSVLLVPMVEELHSSRPVIAGAFSVGLLVMALAAPQVGRWVDRDHAPRVMRGGAWIALAGVVAASQVPSVPALYAAWAVLGLAMASLFYEPALGLVIRTVKLDGERLRALASVTVVAGLASTIFLPVMAFTVKHIGWRSTELAVAVAIVVVSWGMHRHVLPAFRAEPGPPVAAHAEAAAARVRKPATFGVLAVVFVLSQLGSLSLTTVLIPLLVARGQSATTGATVLAALGVMQLPGRIWVLRGGRARSIRGLLALQIGLQLAGMALVAVPGSIGVTALGVACFGGGAGLHTLARPWALQSIYGVVEAGRVNGVMARYEGFARAGGPVSVALLYDHAGALSVFGGLAVALVVMAPITWAVVTPHRGAAGR
ncbi:MAG TPA: MFS transporter [Kofleriaceae bacterium]|nr:MFS transporter [Kofleriaceae bacterium]